jgi:hypothetical protein
MRKETWLLLVLFLSLVDHSLPALAQVSFFQPPTYAGSGNLFTADFNRDGKPDLLSADGTLSLGNGNGMFMANTKVAGTPLAVADFNGDGRPDILEQGTGTLLVLLGNGDGTFQPAISTPSGADLSNVLAADMNGDDKADVVGIFNYNIVVYIAKGDGTFRSGVSTNTGFTSARPLLSLGDFNGDDKTDVVLSTTSCCPASGQEMVFLGKGDGTFDTAKASVGVTYDPAVAFAAVGDFNGDGRLDLAINDWMLLGNGDGTFQLPLAVFAPPPAVGMVAADMDGDGHLDVIFLTAPGSLPGSVEVYLGKGDGSFSIPKSYMTSENSSSGIVLADFNLDGRVDIAAGQAVLLGNGDGTFQGAPLTFVPSSAGLDGAVTGDFDNNGTKDLAILTTDYDRYPDFYYHLWIYSNNGKGSLSLLNNYPLHNIPGYVGDLPYAAAIGNLITADLNLDGALDLVVLGGVGFSVLLGNGDGSFQSPISFPLNMMTADLMQERIVVADFNNDHRPDLAVVSGDEMIAIVLGNGDGSFASPVYYYYVGSGAAVGDFNGDGNVDIAGSGVLFGNGDGSFQPLVVPVSLTNFVAQFTGDLNNDGEPDLLGGREGYAQVVALGNGDGTFTILPNVLPQDAYFLGLTDFNGDGKLDAIINYRFRSDFPNGSVGCATSICNTEFMLGNGDGTFGVETNVLRIVGSRAPLQVLASDMNNDGRTDLIFTWGAIPLESNPLSVGALTVLLNTTPPGFEVSASSISPADLMPGDSGNAIVTILADFGFNNAVTLSCAGLPSGASCTFNPPSIANSSGRSALTITTSASLAAGTYALQVQGRAGSMVNSAAVSLVLSGFSMSPNSETSQTISAGQTASFSLDLAALGSFAGTVNLTCTVTPVVTPAPICSVSSPSAQLSENTGQGVSVTVKTTAPLTTGAVSNVDFPPATLPLAWSLMLLGSTWLLVRSRKGLPVLAAPMMLLALAWVACGGGGSSPSSHTTPGTPAGTYIATVNATSGNLSRSIALQVIVR